jgi:hypothetical protein
MRVMLFVTLLGLSLKTKELKKGHYIKRQHVISSTQQI